MNNPPHPPPQYLTIGEVALTFGVSTDTVRRWSDQRLLACTILPSGHRRYLAQDVEAILATQRRTA